MTAVEELRARGLWLIEFRGVGKSSRDMKTGRMLLGAAEAFEAERDAHSKEIERLKDCLRERPNTLLIAYEYGDHERLSRVAAKALDRADASDARVTALEKVLEPFAAIGRLLEGASGDHAIRETVYTAAFEAAQCLTVGDFRDAASLSPKLGDERAPSKGGAT